MLTDIVGTGVLTLAGVADAITGTADHPIFSEDRGEYVPLGDLIRITSPSRA